MKLENAIHFEQDPNIELDYYEDELELDDGKDDDYDDDDATSEEFEDNVNVKDNDELEPLWSSSADNWEPSKENEGKNDHPSASQLDPGMQNKKGNWEEKSSKLGKSNLLSPLAQGIQNGIWEPIKEKTSLGKINFVPKDQASASLVSPMQNGNGNWEPSKEKVSKNNHQPVVSPLGQGMQEPRKLGADLISEGLPRVTFLISSWRSGSSFVGELLSSTPDSFYLFEPFELFSSVQNLTFAEAYLRNLQSCDLKDKHNFIWIQNSELRQRCLVNQKFVCDDASIAEKICRTKTRQVMKIVQQPVKLLNQFFSSIDSDLFSGIVFVRDPRAVWNSRRQLAWCQSRPDCISIRSMCEAMTKTYLESTEIVRKYPKKLAIVRYEDIVEHYETILRQLFDFMQVPLDSIAAKKLPSYSAHHNGSLAELHWIEELSLEKINEIQRECQVAMKMWGYKFVRGEKDVSQNFNPISNEFFDLN